MQETILLFLFLLFRTSSAQVVDNRPNAALLIGGYNIGSGQQQVSPRVELFGCVNNKNGSSIPVGPFATGVYMLGAMYLKEENKVLACGGYNCMAGNICGITPLCWSWSPEQNTWKNHSYLTKSRYGHIMVSYENEDNTVVPMALGYYADTEIMDPDTKRWSIFNNLLDRAISTDCLLQYDDNNVYHIRTNVTELDMKTWTFKTLVSMPATMTNPMKCAAMTLDGHRGIYIRYGFWLNLTSLIWEKKREPPYNPLAANPNSMWSFRGRPTIFGNPDCKNDGTCEFTKVVQYEPEGDRWVEMGYLLEPRRFHEVVEVPQSVCDYFVATPTTTVTTTIMIRTTTTTLPTASSTATSMYDALMVKTATLLLMFTLYRANYIRQINTIFTEQ